MKLLRAPFGTILLAGKKPFDFAMEETTITAQRAQVVGFSNPYFDANQGVLIAKGVTKPKSIADLKSLQTCAQAATTGLSCILHKLRPAKQPLVYSASSSAAFDAVASGACQALILDVPIIEAQSQKQAGRVRRRCRPDRHQGGLRRSVRQGKPAHAVRQQGDQDAEGERDDRQAAEEMVRLRPGDVPVLK